MSFFNPRHTLKASLYSWQGLLHAIKSEQAVRHIMLIWLVLLLLLAIFRSAPTLIMALAWLGVLAIELVNTAIERICDLVSPSYNVLVKQAKDLGSAASAVAVGVNVVLWVWFLIAFVRSPGA